MAENKRAFIAVRFSAEVIAELGRIQQRLKAALGSGIRIKWVEPRNIHLTLQFLGDVGVEVLSQMAELLKDAFVNSPPFEVVLSGVGAFPSARRPRVVWAGILGGAQQLQAISTRVFEVTEEFGFVPDRRDFKPHVTLGRIRDARKSPDISRSLLELGEARAGSCQIDMVHLIASELKPAGPVYTTLDSFRLGR